jgi:succinate dehydrogenase / fumarate reductase cytochrome b subunit
VNAFRFWRSTVGKKAVMAVTGAVGIGYVIAHSAGNLLVFVGPEAINQYAATLKGNLALLWGLRSVLIAAVVLHVVAAWQLTLQARTARPVGYAQRDPQTSTWGSRSMRWGGLLLLIFIVLHILHLTTGTIDPARVFTKEDVYRNVVVGFRIWWVAAFYIGVMAALGLHLFHGVWSSARSLGLSRPSPTPLKRRIAWVIAIGVWAAFTAVPVAIVAGLVR